MLITYKYDDHVSVDEFFVLLENLSAAENGHERFPARDVFHVSLRDSAKEATSLANSISVTARDEHSDLIGYARVLTDQAYMYYILDVMVDADHRGHGIGTELIQLAIEKAQNGGFIKIFLTAIPGSEPFYEKMGFRPTMSSVLVLRGEEYSKS